MSDNLLGKMSEDEYWEKLLKEYPRSELAATEKEYWDSWNKKFPKPENIETWGQDDAWANPTDNTPVAEERKKYFKGGEICANHGEKLVRTYDMRTRAFGCPSCVLQLDFNNEPALDAKFINEKNPKGFNPYYWRLLYVCGKKGLKGNMVPKDWKQYEKYLVWQELKSRAAKDYGAYLERNIERLRAQSDNVSILIDMIRKGEVEVKPVVKQQKRTA